jgi:hypothetical protein
MSWRGGVSCPETLYRPNPADAKVDRKAKLPRSAGLYIASGGIMQRRMRHDAGNVRDIRPLVLRFVEIEASAPLADRDELTSDDPTPPTYVTSGEPPANLHTKITMVHDETCDDT